MLLPNHKLFIPFSDSLSFSVLCLLESVTVPFHQIKNLTFNPFRLFLSFSSRLCILLLLPMFSLKIFHFEFLIGSKSFTFVRNCGCICVFANGIVAVCRIGISQGFFKFWSSTFSLHTNEIIPTFSVFLQNCISKSFVDSQVVYLFYCLPLSFSKSLNVMGFLQVIYRCAPMNPFSSDYVM